MNIEKMAMRDCSMVHQLGRNQDAFRVSSSDIFWSLAQLKKWVKADQDVLLVAREEGEIIGFALSSLHRPTSKATWENLYVVPRYRGRGVGALLGEELMKQLQEKGMIFACFFVRDENVEEIEYFEGRGFTKGFNFLWFGKQL